MMTGNRTVTAAFFPLLRRGNAVRFFLFVFFVSGSASFAVFSVFLFLGSLFEKFLGSELFFRVSVLVMCFLVGFCLCFCFTFWRVAPEAVWQNSLDVRFAVFWVRSLFFRFSPTSFCFCLFFLFKRQSSGSSRTPPHAPVFVVPFFLSRLSCCFAFFGRASRFLAFSSGCHSGPRAFLGFSWNTWSLSSLAPSEAPFPGTRGGRGVFWLLVLGFLFCPFCFAASHVLLEGPPMARPTAGPGRSTSRPLARVRARGSPSEGGGLVPSCFGIWLPFFFVWQRVTGTLGRTASRAFFV